MMIELLVASHPMYIFHFIYAIASGMVYLIFSIIYYAAGGVDAVGNNFIYHVLKWEKPGSASSVAIGIVVLAIFLHIITCIIQKLRYRLYKKLNKKPTELPINITEQRF
jgi:phosphotransferase system  glucose/maltose/N-acetylglucosamine-specific IIC component